MKERNVDYGAFWDKVARIQIGCALVYMLVYIPCFVAFVWSSQRTFNTNSELWFWMLWFFHPLGILMNFIALGLTIRDLYLRPFPGPNDKLTWSLLIFLTGGLGMFVYYFKHVLKPRI